MSPTISAVPHPRLSLGSPPVIRIKSSFAAQLWPRSHGLNKPSCSLRPGNPPVNPMLSPEKFAIPRTSLGFFSSGNIEFRLKAKSDGKREAEMDEAERAARGESTMPERFRYLTKEAPDPPVRWPFFVGIYAFIYLSLQLRLELKVRALLPHS